MKNSTTQETEKNSTNLSGLQRVGRNIVSIMTSSVLIKATTFILYTLVARNLDTERFGQLSLALSLLYTFHIFAVAGVKTPIVREVTKDKALTEKYFVNGTYIVLLASVVVGALLWLFVEWMAYDAPTRQVIFVVLIGLLPYALSQVCESVFQAWEKMQYIAYANGPAHILKAVAAFLLLTQSFGVLSIAVVVAITYWAIYLIELYLLQKQILRPAWRFDPAFAGQMFKPSMMFLGVDGVFAINSSAAVFVVSGLLTVSAVGLYSSAAQVMVPLALIINDVAKSVFPILCRKFESGAESLSWATERVAELLLLLIIPALVGIFLLADKILMLLYNNEEFLDATLLLQLLVWWALIDTVMTVLGQVLWASKREKTSLQIAIAMAFTNIISTLVFVSLFDLIGVVVAALFVAAVGLTMHYIPVSKILPDLNLLPLFWKPTVAALGMGIYLWLVPEMPLLLQIISGGLIYVTLIALLLLSFSGGVNGIKNKYIAHLS